MAENFVTIAKVSDIPEGEARVAKLDDLRLAVCKVEGKIFVIDDTCTHDDGPLGAGTLEGHAIVCPRHGAKFDVRTGAVLSMPAAFPVKAYKSQVVGDDIQVDLEREK